MIVNSLLESHEIDDIQKDVRLIKLMLLDVDGILTDGGLYFDSQGNEIKKFNTLDGHGLKMLQEFGNIEVGIITGRKSSIVSQRAEQLKLNPELIFQGVENKLDIYKQILDKKNLSPKEVCYMGDDLPDLPILKRVGLSATVPNAPDYIKHYVHYVTKNQGGFGAVREVCDFILSFKGVLEKIINQ